MRSKVKPEYELGQRVSFEDKLWYVSGIRLKTAYILICWEFQLSSGYFGDTKGGPEYVKYTKWLRPEEIHTPEEWKENQLSKIESLKKKFAEELLKLDEQEKEIKGDS